MPIRVGAFCFHTASFEYTPTLQSGPRPHCARRDTLLFRPNYRSLPIRQASFEDECHFLLSARSRRSNRLSVSIPPRRDFNVQFWNESTSSFRYPCLVHVIQVFLLAWTIPSPSDIHWGQRLIAMSLRLKPALLLSSFRLRKTPVSTGSRRIAYLSEFVLH